MKSTVYVTSLLIVFPSPCSYSEKLEKDSMGFIASSVAYTEYTQGQFVKSSIPINPE
jgi:hypothetical protein